MEDIDAMADSSCSASKQGNGAVESRSHNDAASLRSGLSGDTLTEAAEGKQGEGKTSLLKKLLHGGRKQNEERKP